MRRKATKQSPGANAEERAYIQWVSEQGCSVCGIKPVICHHCEGSAFKLKHNFVTVHVGHWFVIPLCQYHDAVVTNESRRAFRERYGPQSAHWERLTKGYDVPEEVRDAIKAYNK